MGVVLVADYRATWLAGLLAGADRETLTTWVLSSDQEHALRQAATAAIQPTVAMADQMNHDVTQLQGQRIVGALPNWRIRCRR
jgi:hypothetical protein